MTKERLIYIDWLRTFSMTMIVWGHFFPSRFTSFVYAFNVPIFFILSGVLIRKNSDWKEFFIKNAKSLMIPYFVICFIKAAAYIFKHIGDGLFVDSFIGIFAGFHTFNDAPGAKLLWFIYTLFILKLLYQTGLFGNNIWVDLLTSGISIAGARIYSGLFISDLAWAVGNTLLAFPFFMMGCYWQTYSRKHVELISRVPRQYLLAMAFVLLFVVWFLSKDTTAARMFEGHYGDNIIMFYIMAILGTLAILLVSVSLNDYDLKINRILSTGGLLILGFQFDLIHPLRKVVALISNGEDWAHPAATLLASVLIMFVFVPLTMIANKWFPFLTGYRKRNFT